jgi:spore cortex formation protein SpoVR/YcgB (stage V sporulation)
MDDIFRRLDEQHQKHRVSHWAGTFRDYLPIALKNPQLAQLAHARVYNEDVVYSLVAPRYNYGAPRIVIANVNDGSLGLEHEPTDLGPLDLAYAEKTLEYLHELWKRPVRLKAFNSQRETTALTYSASGMQIGK